MPWLQGLLPHPGHQEDVVVDAERDQEDEHEQGQPSRPGEAEHLREDQRRDPGPRRRTAPPSPSGSAARRGRAAARIRMSSTTPRIERDDHLVVAGGASGCRGDRGVAADHRIGPVDLVHAVADRSTVANAASGRGVDRQGGLDEATPPLVIGWSRPPRPSSCPVMASATASAWSALATTMDRRWRRRRGRAREDLLSDDRVELLGVGVLVRQAGGVEPEDPEDAHGEQHRGHDPDAARALRDPRRPGPRSRSGWVRPSRMSGGSARRSTGRRSPGVPAAA